MIRITSKRHNFRRCGVAHPKGPVDYPDDKFSKKALEALKAEPMLTVEAIRDQKSEVSGNIPGIPEQAGINSDQKAIEKKKAKRSSVNSK